MKKCDNCGKNFVVKHPSQRFCSHKGKGNCKDRWHNKNDVGRALGGLMYGNKKFFESNNRIEHEFDECEDPGDDMYYMNKDW